VFSVVITVEALEVFTISNFPSGVLTNQVQPEPKLVAAFVENFSLNVSKSQKSLLINSETSPFGSQPALGAIQFQ
jgi:hypothetical protein